MVVFVLDRFQPIQLIRCESDRGQALLVVALPVAAFDCGAAAILRDLPDVVVMRGLVRRLPGRRVYGKESAGN